MDARGARLGLIARRKLGQAVGLISGWKTLVMDREFCEDRVGYMRTLGLFTDEEWRRAVGIREVVRMRKGCLKTGSREMERERMKEGVVFMLREGDSRAAREVKEIIEEDTGREVFGKATGGAVVAVVVAVGSGRRSQIVEDTVGVKEGLRFVGLELGFLPLDEGVVTIDDPRMFRRVLLEGNEWGLELVAGAVHKLVEALGRSVGVVRSAGAAAEAAANLIVKECEREQGSSRLRTFVTKSSSSKGGRKQEVDLFESRSPTLVELQAGERRRRPVQVLLIDRAVDLVTPLLTQWTYEGLLDEAFALSGKLLSIAPETIVSPETSSILPRSQRYTKLLTTYVDTTYRQLRHHNFWSSCRILAEKAESVQSYYASRPEKKASTATSIIKSYVKGLVHAKDSHKGVAIHTALSAEISVRTFEDSGFKRRFETERELIEGATSLGRTTYLLDCCAKGDKMTHVLRLCCLWSLSAGGIDAESLELIRTEIIAAYGVRTVLLLANLERAGLLIRSRRTSSDVGAAQILGFITNLASFANNLNPKYARSEAGEISPSSQEQLVKSSGFSWQFMRAAMRLIVDFDPDEDVSVGPGRMEAIAAPYSGYVGFSVRLVEAGLQGWKSLPKVPDHHSLLPPGHRVKEYNQHVDEVKSGDGASPTTGQSDDGKAENDDEGVDVIVVFIGGVTRAEVSAIRAAGLAYGYRALTATTAVITGDSFIESMDEIVE